MGVCVYMGVCVIILSTSDLQTDYGPDNDQLEGVLSPGTRPGVLTHNEVGGGCVQPRCLFVLV